MDHLKRNVGSDLLISGKTFQSPANPEVFFYDNRLNISTVGGLGKNVATLSVRLFCK